MYLFPVYLVTYFLFTWLFAYFLFTYLFTFNGHTPFVPRCGTLYEREWQKPRGRSIIYLFIILYRFRYILRRMLIWP